MATASFDDYLSAIWITFSSSLITHRILVPSGLNKSSAYIKGKFWKMTHFCSIYLTHRYSSFFNPCEKYISFRSSSFESVNEFMVVLMHGRMWLRLFCPSWGSRCRLVRQCPTDSTVYFFFGVGLSNLSSVLWSRGQGRSEKTEARGWL